MLKIIFIIITIVSLCLLSVLLNVTTPATAGPFGILAIFFFAYMLSLMVVTFFLYWSSRLLSKLFVVFMARKPFEVLTLKNSYYYSTVLAAVPVLLIGLQSVGAVGIYESLLILIFVIIGCLYVSRQVQ